MKRKRQSYRKYKLVPHEVADGPKPGKLESHVEVQARSRGRIGGQTSYRIGPTLSSLPRNNTEENPPAPAPPSTNMDVASDDKCENSNGMQPENVCDFPVTLSRARSNNACRWTRFRLGYPIVTNTSPNS